MPRARKIVDLQRLIASADSTPNEASLELETPVATSYPIMQISLPPSYHHETSDLSTYDRSLPSKMKCCVDRLRSPPKSGHSLTSPAIR
jgi:hypothetical protein